MILFESSSSRVMSMREPIIPCYLCRNNIKYDSGAQSYYCMWICSGCGLCHFCGESGILKIVELKNGGKIVACPECVVERNQNTLKLIPLAVDH